MTALTDAEKDALHDWWDEETTVSVESSFPIISRILTARTAALEAEHASEVAEAEVEGAQIGIYFRQRHLQERAEKAEADLAALQARIETLLTERDRLAATVERVKTLADEWGADDREHLATFGQHHPVAGIAGDHLNAALAGPAGDA